MTRELLEFPRILLRTSVHSWN